MTTWFWKHDSGAWQPYSDIECGVAESHYQQFLSAQAQRSSARQTYKLNGKYSLDFVKMKQFQTQHPSRSRDIRREHSAPPHAAGYATAPQFSPSAPPLPPRGSPSHQPLAPPPYTPSPHQPQTVDQKSFTVQVPVQGPYGSYHTPYPHPVQPQPQLPYVQQPPTSAPHAFTVQWSWQAQAGWSAYEQAVSDRIERAHTDFKEGRGAAVVPVDSQRSISFQHMHQFRTDNPNRTRPVRRRRVLVVRGDANKTGLVVPSNTQAELQYQRSLARSQVLPRAPPSVLAAASSAADDLFWAQGYDDRPPLQGTLFVKSGDTTQLQPVVVALRSGAQLHYFRHREGFDAFQRNPLELLKKVDTTLDLRGAYMYKVNYIPEHRHCLEITTNSDSSQKRHDFLAFGSPAELEWWRVRLSRLGVTYVSSRKDAAERGDERLDAVCMPPRPIKAAMHGVLEKRGGWNVAFQTRFFRLMRDARGYACLAYHANQSSKSAKGVIQLTGAQGALVRVDGTGDKDPCVFYLHGKGRKYVLRANSQATKELWVNVLTRVCQVHCTLLVAPPRSEGTHVANQDHLFVAADSLLKLSGEFVKGWTTRFFALRSANTLELFNNHEDCGNYMRDSHKHRKALLTKISLWGAEMYVADWVETQQHCLQLTTRPPHSRQYMFTFDSRSDLEHWIEEFVHLGVSFSSPFRPCPEEPCLTPRWIVPRLQCPQMQGYLEEEGRGLLGGTTWRKRFFRILRVKTYKLVPLPTQEVGSGTLVVPPSPETKGTRSVSASPELSATKATLAVPAAHSRTASAFSSASTRSSMSAGSSPGSSRRGSINGSEIKLWRWNWKLCHMAHYYSTKPDRTVLLDDSVTVQAELKDVSGGALFTVSSAKLPQPMRFRVKSFEERQLWMDALAHASQLQRHEDERIQFETQLVEGGGDETAQIPDATTPQTYIPVQPDTKNPTPQTYTPVQPDTKDPPPRLVVQPSAPPPQDVPATTQPTEADGSSRTCVVCQDNPPDHAVLMCMHVCLCGECAEYYAQGNGKSCPICRGDVTAVKKIFL